MAGGRFGDIGSSCDGSNVAHGNILAANRVRPYIKPLMNVKVTKTVMRRSLILSAGNVNTLALVGCRSPAAVRIAIVSVKTTKEIIQPMTVSPMLPRTNQMFLNGAQM